MQDSYLITPSWKSSCTPGLAQRCSQRLLLGTRHSFTTSLPPSHSNQAHQTELFCSHGNVLFRSRVAAQSTQHFQLALICWVTHMPLPPNTRSILPANTTPWAHRLSSSSFALLSHLSRFSSPKLTSAANQHVFSFGNTVRGHANFCIFDPSQ